MIRSILVVIIFACMIVMSMQAVGDTVPDKNPNEVTQCLKNF